MMPTIKHELNPRGNYQMFS